MGKSTAKERNWKVEKGRRKSRCTGGKYLKPGTLAQLRGNRSLGFGSVVGRVCSEIGKKREVGLDLEKSGVLEGKVFDESPVMLSPVNLFKSSLVGTPKTPRIEEWQSESRLESLPTELLVKILCHLHHDQLRPVFHVSQRVRKAVIFARHFHFNYTTPDRSRQEMLNIMTPRPSQRWPFLRKRDGILCPSPNTPKAPRHGPRPPSRVKVEMRQVTAVLFREPGFSSRCLMPSNRALFCEDELCKAVSQNKL
ncbi:hypothetical protein RYX36_025382 [Vicia faba]